MHISKAGKNAMLPARTAVLAAANLTGGHFDPPSSVNLERLYTMIVMLSVGFRINIGKFGATIRL